MIEGLRKIDQQMRRVGVRVRKDIDAISEKYKSLRYEAQKERVENKLDFLNREIKAGVELIAGIEDPVLRAKLGERVESLVHSRVDVVQSLPQYAKDADLKKVITLKEGSEEKVGRDTSEESIGDGSVPFSDRRNFNKLPEFVNEGPVDPKDLGEQFRLVKIILPVAGGASGTSAANPIRAVRTDKPRVIPPSHWGFAGSRVDPPAVDARWTSDERDRIVMEYPETRDRGTIGRMWDKIKGSNKIGPFKQYSDENIIRYSSDLTDPTKDVYYVREKSKKGAILGAVAGTAILAWALHEAPATRAGLENLRILTPSSQVRVVEGGNADSNDIRASIRAEIEAQRPIIVREVANGIRPVAADSEAAARQTAAAAREAVQEELASLREIRGVQPVNVPIPDLESNEVSQGNLREPDRTAERLTGRSDQSFVDGMADYLIMRHYKNDWDINEVIDPFNPLHTAKLDSYRQNPANIRTYVYQREALMAAIIQETNQRYPNQGVFSWQQAGQAQEIMIKHNLPDGSKVVPVLPNEQATKRILDQASQQALASVR